MNRDLYLPSCSADSPLFWRGLRSIRTITSPGRWKYFRRFSRWQRWPLPIRRFQFTSFVYLLITLHACILFVGGHYTYAEVPLFNWIRDHFHLARNDYDRVGHFAQGFVPALVAREVLLRQKIVLRRGWLFFIVLSICLAVSAAYELLEWRVAVGTGSAADAFLGTQGDPWDTQEDMATAAVGALTALLFFSRWHDRLISRMETKRAAAQAAG